MKDEIKTAERLGYSKGYAAGNRRKRCDDEERAFFNRALLAALQACVTAEGWQTVEGKPIITLPDRVKLANDFANEARRYFRP